MKKLLYATGNKYKIESMRARIKGTDIEIVSPNDLGIKVNVVEDGTLVPMEIEVPDRFKNKDKNDQER